MEGEGKAGRSRVGAEEGRRRTRGEGSEPTFSQRQKTAALFRTVFGTRTIGNKAFWLGHCWIISSNSSFSPLTE